MRMDAKASPLAGQKEVFAFPHAIVVRLANKAVDVSLSRWRIFSSSGITLKGNIFGPTRTSTHGRRTGLSFGVGLPFRHPTLLRSSLESSFAMFRQASLLRFLFLTTWIMPTRFTSMQLRWIAGQRHGTEGCLQRNEEEKIPVILTRGPRRRPHNGYFHQVDARLVVWLLQENLLSHGCGAIGTLRP